MKHLDCFSFFTVTSYYGKIGDIRGLLGVGAGSSGTGVKGTSQETCQEFLLDYPVNIPIDSFKS